MKPVIKEDIIVGTVRITFEVNANGIGVFIGLKWESILWDDLDDVERLADSFSNETVGVFKAIVGKLATLFNDRAALRAQFEFLNK
jgi:hypothetical protein